MFTWGGSTTWYLLTQSWVRSLAFHITMWYHTRSTTQLPMEIYWESSIHTCFSVITVANASDLLPQHFLHGFFATSLWAPRGVAKLQATRASLVRGSSKYLASLPHFPNACGFVFQHSCHLRSNPNKQLPYQNNVIVVQICSVMHSFHMDFYFMLIPILKFVFH